MSYYVLRQIAPPGKTALAHEATASELANAIFAGRVTMGPCLEWFDVDAKDGFGDDRWTHDLTKAMRFPSFGEAMACWQTQGRVRPIRDDGKPNRPLTAYSVAPERID